MSDLVTVITPIGELNYVNISGKGKENYNEDGYNYVATINLTGDKADSLKKTIDVILGDIAKGENLKSTGYRELMEDDDGVYTPTSNTTERDAKAKKTGITAFTFTTRTTFDDGKKKTVKVFDSLKKLTKLGETRIGNGSEGAIKGKVRRYKKGKDVGVSLFLDSVQLTKLEEYTEDSGFDEQEGGYVAEAEEQFDDGVKTDSAETPANDAVKPKL